MEFARMARRLIPLSRGTAHLLGGVLRQNIINSSFDGFIDSNQLDQFTWTLRLILSQYFNSRGPTHVHKQVRRGTCVAV